MKQKPILTLFTLLAEDLGQPIIAKAQAEAKQTPMPSLFDQEPEEKESEK